MPTASSFPWISMVVLIAFGVAFFFLNMYLLKTRKV